MDFGIGEMKCIDENDIIVINIKNTNIDLCRWYLQKNSGVLKVVYSSKNAQEDFVNCLTDQLVHQTMVLI